MASQCRRFEGKSALVTGGANGFGRATVHRLVDEGLDQVVIVDRDGAAAAAEVEKVRANGGRGFAIECDVSDVGAVEEMAREVAYRCERLHVVVNSAGISGSSQGRLEGDFLPTWDAVMDVNLRGTVLVVRALLPLLKIDGGAIVNISSDGGHCGRRGALVYDASKAGVAQATKSMACELVDYGIRVNDVAPGYAVTGSTSRTPRTPPLANGSWRDVPCLCRSWSVGRPEPSRWRVTAVPVPAVSPAPAGRRRRHGPGPTPSPVHRAVGVPMLNPASMRPPEFTGGN